MARQRQQEVTVLPTTNGIKEDWEDQRYEESKWASTLSELIVVMLGIEVWVNFKLNVRIGGEKQRLGQWDILYIWVALETNTQDWEIRKSESSIGAASHPTPKH